MARVNRRPASPREFRFWMSQLVPSPQHSPAKGGHWRWTPPPSLRRGDDDGGAGLDLRQLWRTLLRRWWLLVLTTGFAGGAAWVWTHSRPRLFQSVATVRISDSRGSLASGLVDGQGGSSRSLAPSSVQSEIEVLRSRRVAARVVEQVPMGTRVAVGGFPLQRLTSVSLADGTTSAFIPIKFGLEGMIVGGDSSRLVPYGVPVDRDGVRFTVAANVTEIGEGSVVAFTRDQAVDQLLFALRVSAREGTDLIDISYGAATPDVAMAVVNGVALSYQAEDARSSQEQSRRRRAFVEEQLLRNDTRLQESERVLGAFRARQQAYSAQEKFIAEQRALSDLRLRQRETDSELRYAQMLLSGMEGGDEAERRRTQRMLAASSGIGELPVVQRLNTQLDGYLARRTELTSGPAGKLPAHPQVERVDSLIADVDAALVMAIRAHASVLSARIQSLNDLAVASENALRGVTSSEVEEARLTQETQILRDQSALLRTEYQRARIAEAAALGHVEIVDLATRAFNLPTPVTRVVVFSLFLGLLAGAGMALAAEGLNRSIKLRDDVEGKLNLPVLATIPQIEVERPTTRKRLPGLRLRRKSSHAEVGARRSGAAEAFRQLTATLFLSRNGDSPRRVLVTSAVQGEGKTSVAANLAIALAQQRLSVLLVDCDLHNPKLHTTFSLPLCPGLAETVLQHGLPNDAVRATNVSGLSVITAGMPGGDFSEVPNSPRFRAIIDDMLHAFHVVILDAPPVLAVADATVMTLSADAVLMVVRAGLVTTDEALEALRTLSSVNAPVVGAVLNDPDGTLRQYGGYSYGYRYQNA